MARKCFCWLSERRPTATRITPQIPWSNGSNGTLVGVLGANKYSGHSLSGWMMDFEVHLACLLDHRFSLWSYNILLGHGPSHWHPITLIAVCLGLTPLDLELSSRLLHSLIFHSDLPLNSPIFKLLGLRQLSLPTPNPPPQS